MPPTTARPRRASRPPAFEPYSDACPAPARAPTEPATLPRRRSPRIDPAVAHRLDVLRAIAALGVLAVHVREVLFVRIDHVAAAAAPVAAGYGLTAPGPQRDVVLFALSGLLIASSVARAHAGGRWSWRWFLTQRLGRLYAVLLPALALTAACDALARLVGGPGMFAPGGALGHLMGPHGARELAANVFFLFGHLGAAFGTNGPLWTLTREFWFYIAFAAGLVATRPGTGGRRLAHAGLALVALGVLYPLGGIAGLLVWLAGYGVLRLPRRPLRPAVWWGAVAAAGATEVLAGVGLHRLPHAAHVTIAGLAAVVLLQLVLTPRAPSPGGEAVGPGPVSRLLRPVARCSFTLYAMHMPPLVLLAAALRARGVGPWAPDLAHGAAGVAVMAMLVGAAWVVALATERRVDRFRDAADRAIGRVAAWAARRRVADDDRLADTLRIAA